jgi:hypothetical protein
MEESFDFFSDSAPAELLRRFEARDGFELFGEDDCEGSSSSNLSIATIRQTSSNNDRKKKDSGAADLFFFFRFGKRSWRGFWVSPSERTRVVTLESALRGKCHAHPAPPRWMGRGNRIKSFNMLCMAALSISGDMESFLCAPTTSSSQITLAQIKQCKCV